MAGYSTDKIRNIVLLGHSGSGKTSLAEAMLFNCGAVNRMGKVEDGNTVSDYDEEEISRTMSLNLSVVPCDWEGRKINLLDAPGYADFQGEMLNGLHVADTAVLVLDGDVMAVTFPMDVVMSQGPIIDALSRKTRISVSIGLYGSDKS